MTRRRRSSRSSRGQKQQRARDVEWVGGHVVLPAPVDGDGAPYRPEALFWMGADGMILGMSIGKPGEVLAGAGTSLQRTIERPMMGPPHAPTRVRVASAELAERLGAEHPDLEVVRGATPELDAMLAEMQGSLFEAGPVAPSLLEGGADPDAVASLFRAARDFYRARPWRIVPDELLFSVTIDALDVQDWVMVIVGQADESHGFALFPDLDAFEEFAYLGEAFELDEEADLPSHIVLSFAPREVVPPVLTDEVEEHGWEVASSDAYPHIFVTEDGSARPAGPEELAIVEAVARAVPLSIGDGEALRAALDRGDPVERTVTAPTHRGPIQVTLRAPYDEAALENEPSEGILAGLRTLAPGGEPEDARPRRNLERELVRRFAGSPEAQNLDEVGACRLVMDLAADFLGETIATLGPSGLRLVLFELIPREVPIDPSEARMIVEESRAFYRYLKREHGLEQADACLRVLEGRTVEKLEAALDDVTCFGPSKALLLGLAEDVRASHHDDLDVEDFDLDDDAHQPTLPFLDKPYDLPRPPISKKAKAKKKAQRKSQRKARKKKR